MKNYLLKELSSSSYWPVNKTLCRGIGLQNTLLLQHFIDLQYNVFNGNEFYQQQERIQKTFGISERQVKQSIKTLIELELISCEKKGIPSKNYYLICEDNLIELLGSLQTLQSGQNELTTNDEMNSQRKELNKKELNKKKIKVIFSDELNDLINLPDEL